MNSTMTSAQSASPVTADTSADSLALVVRRHLRFGWMALLVFLTLGLVLEGLHGFKVQAYLNVMNETRRLMWTLAHAHGTLLGLGNLVFAFSVSCTPLWPSRPRAIASYALIGASVLMPGGFFIGGIWVYAGDPGLGILLVPVGGILLLVAVLLCALSVKYFQLDERWKRNPRVRTSKSR